MSVPPVVRLLVVDDHPVVREGLKAILATTSDLAVVGEAGSAAQALEALRRCEPDVVLLDLRLPDVSGAELIPRLVAERPNVGIVMLSSYARGGDVRACLDAGARAYVAKDAPCDKLFAAIRMVAKGLTYVSADLSARLAAVRRVKTLTPREQEILELIADGCSNRVISLRLGCSVGTVKSHVHSILDKLGVADRTAAVAVAALNGLISPR